MLFILAMWELSSFSPGKNGSLVNVKFYRVAFDGMSDGKI